MFFLGGGLYPNLLGALRLHPLQLLMLCSRNCLRSEAGGLEASESCTPCVQTMPKEPQRVATLHPKRIIVDPMQP